MLARSSEEIRIGGIAVRYRLEGEASGGSVAVFEFDVAPGARVPGAHSHDGFEETIYGLEGVLSWTLDGQQIDVGQAMCCASLAESSTASTTIMRPTRRCWRSSPPASSTPATQRYGRGPRAATGGPPKPAAIGEVMRRHGLSPAP